MAELAPKLSFWKRVGYGVGGLPIGVITNGLAFFLLIYYDQVVGLGAGLTALALAIALLVDAITDPIMGFISDNTQSKLGRRHPFLYLAPIPTAIFFYLIWHPPTDLGQFGLFAYLLVVVIGLRVCVTIFDVPHNAMNADLTRDYDQRTLLAASKVSWGQYAGYIMVIAMYAIWLAPSVEFPDGLMNEAGYKQAGLFGAVLIFISMFAAAMLTHGQRRNTVSEIDSEGISPLMFFKQFGAAFSIPSLRVILLSALCGAIAYGILTALWAYIMGYFWELGTDKTSMILFANFLGAIIATLLAPWFLTRGEKKLHAIVLSCVSIVISAAPFLARFADVMPPNGSDALFWILMVHGLVMIMTWVWITIVSASMTADVVEHGLESHGYQTEGIIFAITTFIAKAGAAGGLVASGTVLVVAGFPEDLAVKMPTADAVASLGWLYMLISSALYLIATICLFGYQITRASHGETVVQVSSLSDSKIVAD